MNKMLMTAALGAALSMSVQGAEDPNAAEAKGIVKNFFTELKGELEAAVKADGPVSAISVCQDRAPEIAAGLSEKTGWEVGRTSLKTRNAELNAPDDWEKQVLVRFEERKAAGEDVKTVAFSEVVEEDGEKRYRFMKAIPTGEICLACHGEHIDAEVAAAIDEAYPDDQAKGFKLGDIRGAFTLAKPL